MSRIATLATYFIIILLPVVFCVSETRADERLHYSTMPWPLPPLDKKEREARLKFFLERQSFNVVKENSIDKNDRCKSILETLRNDLSDTIIKPNFRFRSHIDERAKTRILSKCPHTNINRVYLINGKPIEDDSSIDDMTIHKQFGYSGFHEATANIELYDLSKYMGKGIWGYLAEGVVVSLTSSDKQSTTVSEFAALYNDDKFPYRGHALMKIFNSNTCSSYNFDKFLYPNRLSYSLYAPNEETIRNPTPGFYAFISINGKLYSLVFRVSEADWNNFKNVSRPDNGTLLLNEISPPPHNGNSINCSFSSRHK